MPHMQIRDVNGQAYTIDSADWDTISRWLGETVSRLAPGAAAYHMPLQIQIYPLWRDGQADWATDSRVISRPFTLDAAGLTELLDALAAAGIEVPAITGKGGGGDGFT